MKGRRNGWRVGGAAPKRKRERRGRGRYGFSKDGTYTLERDVW
jgi:hypothetical protein